MRNAVIFSLLLSSLFLAGCATSRDVITLDTSDLKATTATTSNGKTVFINTVVDERVFEANPQEPATPSLDPSESDTPDIRAHAIARKRNGFGKALGDILLAPNTSIPDLVTLGLTNALTEKGYTVLTKKEEVTADTYLVDVKVKKFWSWMNPGAFAITLSTEISTDMVMKNGANKPLVDKNITIKESDNFQTGMTENWIAVMKKAVRTYSAEVSKNL